MFSYTSLHCCWNLLRWTALPTLFAIAAMGLLVLTPPVCVNAGAEYLPANWRQRISILLLWPFGPAIIGFAGNGKYIAIIVVTDAVLTRVSMYDGGRSPACSGWRVCLLPD